MGKKRYFLIFSMFVSIFLVSCYEENKNDDELSGIGISLPLDSDLFIISNDPSPFALSDLYENHAKDSEGENYELVSQYIYALNIIDDKVDGESYEKGAEILQKVWREGAVDAGYDLFMIYSRGIGVERNLDIGRQYLFASANYGYLPAQRTLGLAFMGSSIDIKLHGDEEMAVKWLSLAAMQGDPLSAVNLASCYLKGRGVEKNESLAFDWILKAKDMPYGDPFTAFNALALSYEEGIGTDINLVQAYKYYDLLSPGSAPDKARLEEKMTPEQIREAIRLSRQWQEEHNIYVPSYYGLEYQGDGTFQ